MNLGKINAFATPMVFGALLALAFGFAPYALPDGPMVFRVCAFCALAALLIGACRSFEHFVRFFTYFDCPPQFWGKLKEGKQAKVDFFLEASKKDCDVADHHVRVLETMSRAVSEQVLQDARQMRSKLYEERNRRIASACRGGAVDDVVFSYAKA